MQKYMPRSGTMTFFLWIVIGFGLPFACSRNSTVIFSRLATNQSPVINPTLPPGSRTITFVNKCTEPVWFGLTGGAANNAHNLSSCLTPADCISGSQCIEVNPTTHQKTCFFNTPKPINFNYRLEANGGTNSVAIPTYEANNIVWSGAITGRLRCAQGACAIANCPSDGSPGPDGIAGCSLATGFQQPSTEAEFTLVKGSSDFYDVEVINGVSIPIQVSPVGPFNPTLDNPKNPTDPFFCGSPGAVTPSASSLGACSWSFTPPFNDYVQVSAGGGNCSTDSDCANPKICGISFNPGNANLFQKSCGTKIGYWTADQICSTQPSYDGNLHCSLALQQGSLTELYACSGPNYGGSSGYSTDPLVTSAKTCGCVNWNTVGIQVPSAVTPCIHSNPDWVKYVQPSIQWLKSACPTAYTYPYDDMSSTFTCSAMLNGINTVNYVATFCPLATGQ
jgi:hypothetical protein